MPPLLLAAAAAAAVVLSWVAYMASVPSGRVPVRPVGHVMTQAMGIVLGATALGSLLSTPSPVGTVAATVALATIALSMGGLFLFLLTQRKTPVGDLKGSVGQPLPPFTARTRDDAAFSTDDLKGQRVLLKFFRGHW